MPRLDKKMTIEEVTKEALKLIKEQPEAVKAFGRFIDQAFPGELERISTKIALRLPR